MLNEIKQFETTIIKLSYAYNIKPLEPCDIANELRITLWLNRAKYNKNKGSYKSWAYKVCRNKLKDLARKHKSEPVSLNKLQEKGFDIVSDQQTEKKMIDMDITSERLDELTLKQKEVCKQALNGEKQEDIAEVLGVSPKTISGRFVRAVKRLKTKDNPILKRSL